jgi:hypothetical protein
MAKRIRSFAPAAERASAALTAPPAKKLRLLCIVASVHFGM